MLKVNVISGGNHKKCQILVCTYIAAQLAHRDPHLDPLRQDLADPRVGAEVDPCVEVVVVVGVAARVDPRIASFSAKEKRRT